GKESTVRGPRKTSQPATVSVELAAFAARTDVPEKHPAVVPARGEAAAVRGERHLGDALALAGEPLPLLASLDVPEAGAPPPRPGSWRPIGRKGKLVTLLLLGFVAVFFFAGRPPPAGRWAPEGGGPHQRPAVRDGKMLHPKFAAPDASDLPVAHEVPDADRVVIVVAVVKGQRLSVRGEGKNRYLVLDPLEVPDHLPGSQIPDAQLLALSAIRNQ